MWARGGRGDGEGVTGTGGIYRMRGILTGRTLPGRPCPKETARCGRCRRRCLGESLVSMQAGVQEGRWRSRTVNVVLKDGGFVDGREVAGAMDQSGSWPGASSTGARHT